MVSGSDRRRARTPRGPGSGSDRGPRPARGGDDHGQLTARRSPCRGGSCSRRRGSRPRRSPADVPTTTLAAAEVDAALGHLEQVGDLPGHEDSPPRRATACARAPPVTGGKSRGSATPSGAGPRRGPARPPGRSVVRRNLPGFTRGGTRPTTTAAVLHATTTRFARHPDPPLRLPVPALRATARPTRRPRRDERRRRPRRSRSPSYTSASSSDRHGPRRYRPWDSQRVGDLGRGRCKRVPGPTRRAVDHPGSPTSWSG